VISPGPSALERLFATMVLTAAGAVVAAWTLVHLQAEREPHRVEIAYPERRLLAAAASDPGAPAEVLAAGVTTLVREPYTLDDMLRYKLAQAWHPAPDRLELRFADQKLTGSAAVYLAGQLGMSAVAIRLREGQYVVDARLPAPAPTPDPERFILEIPFGPMPDGFRRALRLPAGDWGATKDLDQFTQALASLRPDVVLPDWRGGVGAGSFYRSYLHTPWLRAPLIAPPEFSLPRAGRAALRRAPRRALVRSHLLEEKELAAQPAARLVSRLVRAARERGVRLLYVQPPRTWTWTQDLAFLRALNLALRRAGLDPGPAAPAAPRAPGAWVIALVCVGAGAAAFLFCWRAALWGVGITGRETEVDRVLTIHLKPAWFRWTALVVALGLLVIHSEGPAGWGLKLAAWLLAVLTPLLGLSAALPVPHREPSGPWLAGAWSDLGRILAWSLGGALALAVLLDRPEFSQRLDGFVGVKAAYLVPWALAGLYLFPQITDGAWWRERLAPGQRTATVLGVVLCFGLLALLWLRSGHSAWLPASWPELDLRDRLESLLGVRPRFKEFLFGHPLLLLGLAARRWPRRPGAVWPEVCILLGMVGQFSLINSFCHAHTPLGLTLLRTLYGLLLGGALGLAAQGLGWRLRRASRA
jgi:hypothetical protein